MVKKKVLLNYGSQNLNNLNFKKISQNLIQQTITNGNNCLKFEKNICKLTNSKFAVVCNNGTSALMMSILSLNIKNPIVIIPNINFVASSSILALMKAKIILCDVNVKTGMVDETCLISILKKCKNKKIKPNLFIPIHYAGDILNMKNLSIICKKNNIKIIEDGCHSFGSKSIQKNQSYTVGHSKYSEMTTFSFHPVKNITTIEGGAITTNNKKLYRNLLLLRSHSLEKTFKSDPYKMLNPSLNFRMAEINAIIGIDQLKKLSYFKKYKNNLVKEYLNKFKKLENFFTPINFIKSEICWHIFAIRLKNKYFNKKEKFMNYLNKNNITTQIHYKPIYKHNVYKKFIILSESYNSDIFYRSQLTLPLHTQMTKNEIEYVFKKINLFFSSI